MTIRCFIAAPSQIEVGSLELTEYGRLLDIREERELILDRGGALNRDRRTGLGRRERGFEGLIVGGDRSNLLGGGLRFGDDRSRGRCGPRRRRVRTVDENDRGNGGGRRERNDPADSPDDPAAARSEER